MRDKDLLSVSGLHKVPQLTIVRSLSNGPFRHLSVRCLAVWESTAARGSSRRRCCVYEYTALARATRAFCPPLKMISLSYVMHELT